MRIVIIGLGTTGRTVLKSIANEGHSISIIEEHFSEGDDFANIYHSLLMFVRSLLMFVAEQERKNIALRTGS
ncbi:MAG TPA: hypothetical protein IAD28_03450 [Candidatus Faeciplasma avium]|uniref:Uncharacterized protein n=1 Tax=Candidatus Faeciplasma avium TaxID=2840798 RepID=A0A9D1T435_9FIRM|nr:hypothetical protein [Candidatus Faeciplasma avium]